MFPARHTPRPRLVGFLPSPVTQRRPIPSLGAVGGQGVVSLTWNWTIFSVSSCDTTRSAMFVVTGRRRRRWWRRRRLRWTCFTYFLNIYFLPLYLLSMTPQPHFIASVLFLPPMECLYWHCFVPGPCRVSAQYLKFIVCHCCCCDHVHVVLQYFLDQINAFFLYVSKSAATPITNAKCL